MRHDSDILALYLAHRRELVNYANGIVGDRAQAEDLVQEAWLRFGAVAERRLLEEPIGYLYRIVRNLASTTAGAWCAKKGSCAGLPP